MMITRSSSNKGKVKTIKIGSSSRKIGKSIHVLSSLRIGPPSRLEVENAKEPMNGPIDGCTPEAIEATIAEALAVLAVVKVPRDLDLLDWSAIKPKLDSVLAERNKKLQVVLEQLKPNAL